MFICDTLFHLQNKATNFFGFFAGDNGRISSPFEAFNALSAVLIPAARLKLQKRLHGAIMAFPTSMRGDTCASDSMEIIAQNTA